MKRQELSSTRSSETEMVACPATRWDFVPSATSTVRWWARQAQLSAVPLRAGGLATTQGSRLRVDLEAAIKLQPEATSLHYPLAMAYRKPGDVANALVHLKEKGSVTPKVPDPLMDALYELKRG